MMMLFLLERLQERTTWLGLTAFATAGGINLAPEVANLVITTGMSIAGLIGVITKDK